MQILSNFLKFMYSVSTVKNKKILETVFMCFSLENTSEYGVKMYKK